jgi:hypothetical protein
MNSLIQTAIEQNWTIGQLNQRIKEFSSLNFSSTNSLDNDNKQRGDKKLQGVRRTTNSYVQDLLYPAKSCLINNRKVFKLREVK